MNFAPTSFNVRGESVIYMPDIAFHCCMGAEFDVLNVGNFLLLGKDHDPALRKDCEAALFLHCLVESDHSAEDSLLKHLPKSKVFKHLG